VVTPLCSIEEDEVMGLLIALQWMHDLQIGNADFEFDSKKSS
jgi:ribonuclease HI